jgi:hypothetical protein
VTLLTVTPPEAFESEEMKANNSSFGTAVENAGLVTEVLGDVLSVEVTTSIATPGGGDGFTVRVAVWVAPYVPEMTTAVLVATTLVVIVNVAEVAPEEIVTLGGTVATVELLLSIAVSPPAERRRQVCRTRRGTSADQGAGIQGDGCQTRRIYRQHGRLGGCVGARDVGCGWGTDCSSGDVKRCRQSSARDRYALPGN